jgi:hypothetical protein
VEKEEKQKSEKVEADSLLLISALDVSTGSKMGALSKALKSSSKGSNCSSKLE